MAFVSDRCEVHLIAEKEFTYKIYALHELGFQGSL